MFVPGLEPIPRNRSLPIWMTRHQGELKSKENVFNLFCFSYSHHASHHTHNPMVGRYRSSFNLLIFISLIIAASFALSYHLLFLLLHHIFTRSGQILWIRGLTRLQTQVGEDVGILLCTPECISISVKVDNILLWTIWFANSVG